MTSFLTLARRFMSLTYVDSTGLEQESPFVVSVGAVGIGWVELELVIGRR